MARKLVAPGITEGEWNTYQGTHDPKGPFRNERTVVAETDNDVLAIANCDFFTPQLAKANARFLAGSKRASEAAAALIALLDEHGFVSTAHADDLRAALIAQGYSEKEE